ncbi:hypothetical protein N0V90_008300 [Kalmusia sp. IMI 367209]|nr:hypothetical protein N0V90_008300 [Kalmusia sp. IMI 367209]
MSSSSDIIAIKVGPKQQTFLVHETLLAQHSDYFRKTIVNIPKGGKERKVAIPDIEPDIFTIFVNWLYSQHKDAISWSNTYSESKKDKQIAAPPTTEVDVDLVKALVLGDRFAAWEFKKAINNYYVNVLIYNRATPDYNAIAYAFTHFPWDHPITRLMIDTEAIYRDGEFEQDSRLPTDFVNRRTKRAQELRGDRGQELRPCAYHEHSSDAEKRRCESQCALWK